MVNNDARTGSGVQEPDLKSNPTGYLDFFGFRILDWISFSFQPDPDSDPDYPNEIKSGCTKILVWDNSCMRKITIFRKHMLKICLSDFTR